VSKTLGLSTVVVLASVLIGACGDDSQPAAGGPFELIVHPEFVQGVFPNEPVTLLVTIEDAEPEGDAVSLDVSSTGNDVSVEPSEIREGEIAEVTLVAAEVSDELETEVVVRAQRGAEEREVTKSVIVMPGQDELEPMARDVLGLFLPWLEENYPEFGIGPDSEFSGMLVAPRLLVVSHYAFFTPEYELGLSWHIMVAPDDWADLYIRPRDSLQPTAAFRLSSWGTALSGGEFEIAPTDIPVEVVR
jgi:hypothetical protein